MMKKFARSMLVIALFSSAFLLSCTNDDAAPTDSMQETLENLSGTYMDLEPYSYGTAYGQRIFTFAQGSWTLKFTLGLDPNLENKIFEFRTHGSYQITGPSTIVEGAYNAEFGEDKKIVKLKTDTPELIEAFGFASCGLTPNEEKDISIDGCALWKSVAECPIDFDLLSLDEEGLLYFGLRPADNDMCSVDKRPEALTPAVTKI